MFRVRPVTLIMSSRSISVAVGLPAAAWVKSDSDLNGGDVETTKEHKSGSSLTSIVRPFGNVGTLLCRTGELPCRLDL